MKKCTLVKMFACASIIAVMSFLQFFPAQAIEYGGFGGRPAFPRADNSRTESIFVHTLLPGVAQEEGVLVVNNTTERKTLLVYAADSTPSSGGGFACKQYVEEKTGVGAWITLAKEEVTLDPGLNEMVPFTIRVPENADVGEHNGCILIQEKKDKVEGQAGAVLSVRTGLRIAVTVPGDIERILEITDFTITQSKSGFLLHPLIKNTGNVSVDADVRVETDYFFGLNYTMHEGRYPILRGDTSELNFVLPKPFWGGWYRSSLAIVYDEHSTAEIGIESGSPLTQLEKSPVWFFSFPTPLAFVIELSLLLLVVFLVWFFAFRKKVKKSGRAK